MNTYDKVKRVERPIMQSPGFLDSSNSGALSIAVCRMLLWNSGQKTWIILVNRNNRDKSQNFGQVESEIGRETTGSWFTDSKLSIRKGCLLIRITEKTQNKGLCNKGQKPLENWKKLV